MSKSYDLVAIKFLDHAFGGGDRVDSTNVHKVWGLLVDQDESFYYVYHWVRNGDLNDTNNTELSSIMKCAVLEIWELGTDTIG